MCGRYNIISTPEAIRRLLGYVEQPNFPPRYNVAPTQPVPIVRLVDGQRRFALVRWGLLPPWVKDPKAFTLLINARGESANDKPSFKNAMKRRRCLIPADGFYEWQRDGVAKRPYLVRLKGGGAYAFAGLWETWIGPNGEELETAAIVTTDANDVLRPIHHRMPVILEDSEHEAWLDCARVNEREAMAMIRPARAERLEAFGISPAVNRVVNDDASLLEPYTAPPESLAEPVKPKPPRSRAKDDDGQASLF